MSNPTTKKKWISLREETKKEEWGGFRTSWYTRRGALKAVCHNIREVLDVKYYEQLEDELMGYKEVSIRNYFEHLDAYWCKMNTKTVQKMTAEFYEPWDQQMHITKFAKRLDRHQAYLATAGIEITDESKLQFYIEQMVDCAMFEKREIVAWEN